MKWELRGREMGSRGVALLQALIFVGLIAMTAATLLSLTLGGFIGASKTATSEGDKFSAMSILPRVYADLAFCDPDSDGDFDPAANCSSTSDVSKTWPNLSGNPPSSTITYDLEPGDTSSRDISARITYCSVSSSYKIGITPCEGAGPCAPSLTCP